MSDGTVGGRVRVSAPGVELRDSEDYHLSNIINVQKREGKFALGLDAAKNKRYSRGCRSLNLAHKSRRTPMSVPFSPPTPGGVELGAPKIAIFQIL